ncbi:MAG: ribonuclease III [SAR324 cluster bacterium]|nr:ribonuclease III [SAR324 cluster bacterium]
MFESLSEALGYQFQNPEILKLALTHKSWSSEKLLNNERLEFLGDAILDLVITECLMTLFPEASEGILSKLRSTLVNEQGLNRVAINLNLGQFLFLGKGEEMTGGRSKPSLLSNALEAVFAAIYIDSKTDSGLSRIAEVIEHLFDPYIPKTMDSNQHKDPKTELQELVQKQFRAQVHYELLEESGPDHQKLFEIAVMMDSKELGRGKGSSKKQAEQAAAGSALIHLHEFSSSTTKSTL